MLSNELQITPPLALAIFKPYATSNEHKSLRVKSGTNSQKNASYSLRVIKAIALITDFDDSLDIDLRAFKGLSVKSVSLFLESEDKGRFKTLPPALVFKSICDAFEYSIANIDHIFESMLTFLKEVPKTQKKARALKVEGGTHSTITELECVKRSVGSIINKKTFEIGVRVQSIPSRGHNRHKLVRENFGLFECYSVLMGSLQIATGSLMARRIGEIIDLKPQGNLYPDTDPTKNIKTEYFLYFDNRKSGVSGKETLRDRIKRPIPHSIAIFIWKTEQFNKELLEVESSFVNPRKSDDMSLFNSIDKVECRVNAKDSVLMNRHFDIFCDYFETPTVLINGEVHRYYIRQHQLRRFFALMFFWSKGYDGLDTLRHFLGHTDVSHLFHYITENLTGKVLNGVKASTLVSKHARLSVKNYSDLINLIKLRYGSDDAEFLTSAEAVEDYADAENTVPPIEFINQQSQVENHVLNLLEMKIITLEPEFFTVQHVDGSSTQDFTLVLKIIKD